MRQRRLDNAVGTHVPEVHAALQWEGRRGFDEQAARKRGDEGCEGVTVDMQAC